MPTRNVVLTEHQAQLIERLVGSGRYQNASEVLREGLRLLERRDQAEQVQLAALREAAAMGMADLEAGRFKSFNTPDELRSHLAALTEQVLSKAAHRP